MICRRVIFRGIDKGMRFFLYFFVVIVLPFFYLSGKGRIGAKLKPRWVQEPLKIRMHRIGDMVLF